MVILGIETSCDETALALIETRDKNGTFECRVISSLINSQAELHSAYGGVFPNLAKREHGKNLLPLLKKLLSNANSDVNIDTTLDSKQNIISDEKLNSIIESFRSEIESSNPDLFESFVSTNVNIDFLKNIPRIDRIAVTEGPGLEPALWVGINFAKIISALWSIPIIPINHMEGHIVGSLLDQTVPQGTWQQLKALKFPAIALLISGGHTELVRIEDGSKKEKINENEPSELLHLHYTIMGQTKDDAVGEAFDKTARLLGLPYPGGPHISKLSAEAKEKSIISSVKLPRPMIHSGNLDFSFSGLKTAVLYAVRDNTKADKTLSDDFKKGLAREFEEAVTETLSVKLKSAIEEINAQTIIIGGGVSANKMLQERFTKLANEFGLPIYLPSQHISGDNALMIALAGALDTNTHSENLKAQGTKKLG
ncbi:MAG: tRNA (adenosine(37)-N6)-threonylcarbamoyltransferase complex transferase subunit TsaD [Candidatus Paceibacterota bacterium]|jgi:N6-L-threonylcarbamoyladenine synthase